MNISPLYEKAMDEPSGEIAGFCNHLGVSAKMEFMVVNVNAIKRYFFNGIDIKDYLVSYANLMIKKVKKGPRKNKIF